MQFFELGAAANDTQYLPARHRTLPIPESVTPIANSPTKLPIFKTRASRYWQVRCYLRGKTYTQSLKTTNKSAAISQAKQFFHIKTAELYGEHVVVREDRPVIFNDLVVAAGDDFNSSRIQEAGTEAPPSQQKVSDVGENQFFGAAQQVTGSCYLLESPAAGKILLECGMQQGGDSVERTGSEEFAFAPDELDSVILSHAHLDHSGMLPKLVRAGFRGPIYCTTATRGLSRILLEDSYGLYERDLEHENTRRQRSGRKLLQAEYTLDDVRRVHSLCKPAEYESRINHGPLVTLLTTSCPASFLTTTLTADRKLPARTENTSFVPVVGALARSSLLMPPLNNIAS